MRTTWEFQEKLSKFLRQNKTFSVRSMENLWVISKSKDIRKLTYYYISKLLKKGVIRKTNKYEKQSSGEKPLLIYEVIRQT